MLEFFRRYQRGFFIVITVMIVISFAFFGTFQTFANKEQEDTVSFTAIDGSKVYRSEVADLVAFLSSDSHDFIFSGSSAGNPLNDGVLANDILESGLAQVIAAPYLTEIGQEQQVKLDREKRYKAYTHPKAPFLTSEQIWTYYAPDIKSNLDLLRTSESAKSKDAFAARVNLFVAERNFPSPYLRQFLRYQESSHKWLSQDPSLAHQDLALFGYHSTQDWFGHQFVEICAQFIINSARFAEQKGFDVTKDEVLGALFRNATESYREGRAHGAIQAANVGDFFNEQLRRLGMDQSRAVRVWKEVLLFRTLFFENADSVLVDTSSYKDFFHHLNEYVDIDLYQLPKDLRFAKLKDLEQFAIYLSAVRPPVEGVKNDNLLSIPLTFATTQQVKKVYPELVERTFIVKVSEINKESLGTKIGVKGTWEWQVDDKNWQQLKSRYQELSGKDDATTEQRLKLLDGLDPAKRAIVDTHSRQSIIEQNPELVKKALEKAPAREEEIVLREQGGPEPFEGFKNTSLLISLLDKAPLNELSEELSQISQDGVHIYQIQLLDRSKPERILSFNEAKEDGTLEALLNKVLETSYPRIRNKDPSVFLKENGEWKNFKEVKDEIAQYYFQDLFRLLDHEIEVFKNKMPNFTDWANREKAMLAVSLLPYVQEEALVVKEKLAKSEQWPDSNESDKASSGPEQFTLVKSEERLVRSGPNFVVNPDLAFSLEMESMSPITSYQSSGPQFFMVVEKGFLSSDEMIRSKVLEERELLGREAIIKFGGNLLATMQKKGSYNIEMSSENKTSPNTSSSPSSSSNHE